MPVVSSHWEEGQKDVKVHSRSFTLIIDHPLDQRGTDLGPTPSETLLSALAGCFTGTMLPIARAMNIPLTKIDIKLTATKGEKEYESLRSIHLEVKLDPRLQDRGKFERLVEQTKRNCTISNTLSHSPEITISQSGS
ncbi:MAG: OsmC family protein [Nitrososphaerota archaeon]|nr:OsmC family protein [Nitrososphaerota archaeon]MDG7001361.1 OsmC family protein [Nitrososphaerota archaeon]